MCESSALRYPGNRGQVRPNSWKQEEEQRVERWLRPHLGC